MIHAIGRLMPADQLSRVRKSIQFFALWQCLTMPRQINN